MAARLLAVATYIATITPANACTSFIVTPGASADGSLHFTYAADNSAIYGEARLSPAQDHPSGSVLRVVEADTGVYLGEIPQVPHTLGYVGGAQMGGINERQVGVAETTFGGAPSLQKQPGALVDYAMLLQLALQRASSAREAIEIMTTHVEKYGYASEGESFTIADPREAWVMDMIGKGEGEIGAVWVAMRVPDGHISGHANQARITTFPRDDPANCLHAKDAVSFAVAKGLWPADAPDEAFDFAAAYDPITFTGARASDARVWDFFSRVGGDPDFAAAHLKYISGIDLSERLPFSIRPAIPVALNDTIWAARSKFEGTALDMTRDVGASGYESPFRAMPLFWDSSGRPGAAGPYFHERPAATPQTGWHFVGQLRSWMPPEAGGILWYGVDDTGLSPRTPLFAGISKLPPSYTSTPSGEGSFADASTLSFDSAFWVNNLVANLAYWQYNLIAPQVHAAIALHEAAAFADVAALDKRVVPLLRGSDKERESAIALLTEHSVSTGQRLTATWFQLFQHLFSKHRDGVVATRKPGPLPDGPTARDTCPLITIAVSPHPQPCVSIAKPGYAPWWYERLIEATGNRFKVQTTPELFVAARGQGGPPSLAISGDSVASSSRHARDSRLQLILESGSGRSAPSGGPAPSEAAQTSSTADAWHVATAAVAHAPAYAAMTIATTAAAEDTQPQVAATSTPWAIFAGVFTAGMVCGGMMVYAGGASARMTRSRLQSHQQRLADADSVDATPYRAI